MTRMLNKCSKNAHYISRLELFYFYFSVRSFVRSFTAVAAVVAVAAVAAVAAMAAVAG